MLDLALTLFAALSAIAGNLALIASAFRRRRRRLERRLAPRVVDLTALHTPRRAAGKWDLN